ncbi:acyl-CoA dehydrogenase family protein [Streptomyces sp. NBC_01304]|uniref:acyl-CoA dehydrogenase family protein n=1 Tax=Streptomyces sp. NBC_01304 TaxID=2903818 RepID=UPI002E140B2E|nr:acyl-CoA oxidase [Streptomyces sp. NBC_01304]
MTLQTFQEPPRLEASAPTEPNEAVSPSDLSFLPIPPTDPSRELAHLLFDRENRRRLHGMWRRLISTEEFRHRSGLSPAERIALSYDRLRILNETVGSPEALANDPSTLASLHEWTGVVDGSLGTLAGIHYNLFLGSLLDQGDRDGTGDRRDLSDFTSLRRTGTFLCTELDHGNDAAALQTTAELNRETGEFILHTPHPGARKFMPNTSLIGGPKSALVAARLVIDGEDHGVFLFLTPLSDASGHLPGVRVQALPSRSASPVDHCLTTFDQVRLPREALLEAEHGRLNDDGTLTSNLGNRRKRFLRSIDRITTGKLCMSAAGIGVTRAALAIAVRYAHDRHISGPRAGERVPLTAHRSHHSRLLRSVTTAYAMTFLHRSVVSRYVRHTAADRAQAERLVAIAKGWITWQARTITTECRERCGAQGLFSANGLADFPLNLEGAITAEGDNLVIWVKAAAEMIFGHQTERRDRPELPVENRSLTDLHFLRGLLAEVEALWQARARTALRSGPARDPLARWNDASAPALQMVSAHAQLQAADAFIEAAAQAVDPATRLLIEDLCRLFLLQQVSEYTGDLLAEGHLCVSHVRELPGAVDATISFLAPHLMTLVDAFDLPAGYLAGIPIASGSHIGQHVDELTGLSSLTPA